MANPYDVLRQGLEIITGNLGLLLPFFFAAATALVIEVIKKGISETSPAFQTASFYVLTITTIIVVLAMLNWGFYLIAQVIKTKKMEMKNSFEASLPYLIKLTTVAFIYFFVIAIGYLVFLLLKSYNEFWGGAGLVLIGLIILLMLFTWGVAPQALYHNNLKVLSSLGLSNRILTQNRIEFLVLMILFIIVAGLVWFISYLAHYFGPTPKLFFLGFATFFYIVWTQVCMFVFFRDAKLRKV